MEQRQKSFLPWGRIKFHFFEKKACLPVLSVYNDAAFTFQVSAEAYADADVAQW